MMVTNLKSVTVEHTNSHIPNNYKTNMVVTHQGKSGQKIFRLMDFWQLDSCQGIAH